MTFETCDYLSNVAIYAFSLSKHLFYCSRVVEAGFWNRIGKPGNLGSFCHTCYQVYFTNEAYTCDPVKYLVRMAEGIAMMDDDDDEQQTLVTEA